MTTTIMQTVRTLALLALVIFSAMAAHQAKQQSKSLDATPAIDTAAGNAAATIRLGGDEPGVTFPIIHGARDVAKFLDELVDGLRKQGYAELRLELPPTMRPASASAATDSVGEFSPPLPQTPKADTEPQASEQPAESGCECAGGVCPSSSGSWRRGRR